MSVALLSSYYQNQKSEQAIVAWWTAENALEERIGGPIRLLFSTYFRRELKVVLKALSGIPLDKLLLSASSQSLQATTEAELRVKVAQKNLLAEMKFQQHFSASLKIAGEIISKRVAIQFGFTWPGYAPGVEKWIGNHVPKVVDQISQTTRLSIRDLIKKAVAEGASRPQMQQRIEQLYTGWQRSRPKLIARMESGFVAAVSEYNTVGSLPIPNSQKLMTWVTERDPKVRKTHVKLDGVTIQYGKLFPNGLRFPRDPNGKPSEIMGCRCRIKWSVGPAATPVQELPPEIIPPVVPPSVVRVPSAPAPPTLIPKPGLMDYLTQLADTNSTLYYDTLGAVRSWSEDGYRIMRALQTGDAKILRPYSPATLAEMKKRSDLVDGLFDRVSLTKRSDLLYRGLRLDAKSYRIFLDDIKDNVLEFKSMASASKDRDIALYFATDSKPILLEMEDGIGLDIMDISSHRAEQETIIRKGVKFDVISIDQLKVSPVREVTRIRLRRRKTGLGAELYGYDDDIIALSSRVRAARVTRRSRFIETDPDTYFLVHHIR